MTRCADKHPHKYLYGHSSGLAVIMLALVMSACSSTGTTRRYSPPAAAAVAPPPVAATVAKGDPETRFKAALQLMKGGQPKEAQAEFLALSQEFPNLSGPHTNLGILYAQARQREQAAASLSKAIAANPNNAVALNWLGTMYREGGDFVRAEQFYRRALTARGDYADAYLNLAILYDVSMRKPQDALTQYRNYQRVAGPDNTLIVSAWIKEIETSAAGTVASNSVASKGAVP